MSIRTLNESQFGPVIWERPPKRERQQSDRRARPKTQSRQVRDRGSGGLLQSTSGLLSSLHSLSDLMNVKKYIP